LKRKGLTAAIHTPPHESEFFLDKVFLMSDSQLLIVGSVGLDTVRTPYVSGERILGGTAVYASCSASHFAKSAIVGVVGGDFPLEHEKLLESKSVDLTCLERRPGATFHWKGYYEGDMNQAITEDTQLGVFGDFSPKIPDSHRQIPFLFLGNIHPQLQLDVLDAMSYDPIVAADTMNFWINGEPELLRKVIARVQIMLVNDGEARMISGKTKLLDAADFILDMGPKVVVIKKGEHGAMLFSKEDIFAVPAIPLRTAKDPTGAGDTFAGGMMGCLAMLGNMAAASLRQAAAVGTVMASFTVEELSLNRLASVKREDIRERLQLLRKLTDFGEIKI